MQNPDLVTSTRFVLMILANRSDPEGLCWPSIKYIQARTGLGNSTVRAACKELEDMGLIEIKHQIKETGAKTSNAYYMLMPPPPPPTIGGTPRRQRAVPPPTIGGNTKVVNEGGSKEPTYLRKTSKSKPLHEQSDAELITKAVTLHINTRGLKRDELVRAIEGKLQ